MSVRLINTLLQSWETFDGIALENGLPDLRTLPLDRGCNWIYYRLTKDGDEKSIEKLRAKLWMPVDNGPVLDKRSPWNAENETKGLAALGAALGISPKMPAAGANSGVS